MPARKILIVQVDAFTTRPFTGNPAGVVPAAEGLTGRQMQAIARELGNSETAFILPPEGPDHQVRLRYFTPTVEVPSCGHATIAAHYVRALEGKLPPSTLRHKIGIGVLEIGIEREENDYRIVMTQGAPAFEDPLPAGIREEILDALGIRATDMDDRCPVQVASTGHSKVMVGIRSLERLHGLTPDGRALQGLSERIGCNGYFTFVLTEGEEHLSHGRMFAPAIGIPEDPVTGNANGPLGAYLVRHGLARPTGGRLCFLGRQGEAMGRPGTVEVRVDAEGDRPVRVRVAGRAVVVFQATLEIPPDGG